MKHFLFLLAFAFMNVQANAQQSDINNVVINIEGLKATVNNNSLQINWKSYIYNDAYYWEVQASADGKHFSTIGLVLGENPKGEKGQYTFKQTKNKIKPGMKFFRVLHIESDDRAVASNTISILK